MKGGVIARSLPIFLRRGQARCPTHRGFTGNLGFEFPESAIQDARIDRAAIQKIVDSPSNDSDSDHLTDTATHSARLESPQR